MRRKIGKNERLIVLQTTEQNSRNISEAMTIIDQMFPNITQSDIRDHSSGTDHNPECHRVDCSVFVDGNPHQLDACDTELDRPDLTVK